MRQKFARNTSGTDYFVGDLHGCVDELMSQLRGRDFDPESDRLFCVGDLVDRGPANVRTLALLEEPWFFSVIGNHDHMMIETLTCDSQHVGGWQHHYGQWINNEEYDADDLRGYLLKAIKMPLTIEIDSEYGSIGIVHSEVPGFDWDFDPEEFRNQETCLWSRKALHDLRKDDVKNIDIVVHGHTVMAAQAIGNRCYLDTGAVFSDGYMTIKSDKELSEMVNL